MSEFTKPTAVQSDSPIEPAKDDTHADRIVQGLREEFDKPNDFAVKITYRTSGRKPEELLAEFRTAYNPRIAVTVDMIATGTDIKPLECVFFLRVVRFLHEASPVTGRSHTTLADATLLEIARGFCRPPQRATGKYWAKEPQWSDRTVEMVPQ
jgi:hypothetical protein